MSRWDRDDDGWDAWSYHKELLRNGFLNSSFDDCPCPDCSEIHHTLVRDGRAEPRVFLHGCNGITYDVTPYDAKPIPYYRDTEDLCPLCGKKPIQSAVRWLDGKKRSSTIPDEVCVCLHDKPDVQARLTTAAQTLHVPQIVQAEVCGYCRHDADEHVAENTVVTAADRVGVVLGCRKHGCLCLDSAAEVRSRLAEAKEDTGWSGAARKTKFWVEVADRFAKSQLSSRDTPGLFKSLWMYYRERKQHLRTARAAREARGAWL